MFFVFIIFTAPIALALIMATISSFKEDNTQEELFHRAVDQFKRELREDLSKGATLHQDADGYVWATYTEEG